MSQRRNNVVAFVKSPNCAPKSSLTKLASVKCVMLRAGLPKSRRFGEKAERLQAAAPDLAAIVEELVDDLLAEVS